MPGYVMTSHRQAVADALGRVIPKEHWALLSCPTKALLVATVVCHDRARYCGTDGALKVSLSRIFLELFGKDGHANGGIHTTMGRNGLLKSNGLKGSKYKAWVVATREVQDCLSDLAIIDKPAEGLISRVVLDRADELFAEFGREQVIQLIQALGHRAEICLPRLL